MTLNVTDPMKNIVINYLLLSTSIEHVKQMFA